MRSTVSTGEGREIDHVSSHDSSRHELNSARTQSAILQVALEAFSQYGLKGASLREIAAQAGVQHALIRYHFKTKEELWKAALRYLFARMHDEASIKPAEIARSTPLEIFRIWLRRYLSYCARRPEHARLLMQESVEGGPLLDWSVDNFVRDNFMASRSMLIGLQAAGHIREVDLDSLCYIISASCQNVFVLAHQFKTLTGRDPRTQAFIEEHAQTIEALLIVPEVCDTQS